MLIVDGRVYNVVAMLEVSRYLANHEARGKQSAQQHMQFTVGGMAHAHPQTCRLAVNKSIYSSIGLFTTSSVLVDGCASLMSIPFTTIPIPRFVCSAVS